MLEVLELVDELELLELDDELLDDELLDDELELLEELEELELLELDDDELLEEDVVVVETSIPITCTAGEMSADVSASPIWPEVLSPAHSTEPLVPATHT